MNTPPAPARLKRPGRRRPVPASSCCASCDHYRPWPPFVPREDRLGHGVCTAMLHAFPVTRDSGTDCEWWERFDLAAERRREKRQQSHGT